MQVFAMRSIASGAAFHRACPHATQQALRQLLPGVEHQQRHI
jgi:DNA-binding GntR family transcriptional regulator